MSDPKIIYLGPACQKDGDGREWCEGDVWPDCECGCSSVRYVLESTAQTELTALKAELASEEQDHAELRGVVAALREENERLKSESFEGLYNEAIEERDALRGELAKMTADRDQLKGIASAYIASDGAKDLQIAAAEQRNADLVELLRDCKRELFMHKNQSLHARLDAALKPTESGASE